MLSAEKSANDSAQSPGLVQGTLLVPLEQRLEHVAAQASSRRDQALVITSEKLPVHARLVVVALEKREAGQLDEISIALVGLGEEREVVVQLLATLGVATGVVNAATARRTLTASLVRHVRLGADDRLDTLGTALLEELEDPVHVAVIGDPKCRLTICHGLGDEVIEARRPIQHRELGVDMEVGE